MFNFFKKKKPRTSAEKIEDILDILERGGVIRGTQLPDQILPPGTSHQVSASEHLYFAVRSVAADGRQHVMQYAFVDDRGNVALSAFVRSSSPATMFGGAASEDLSVEPMEEAVFATLVAKLCRGATLVAFHRVLQTGLLPAGAVESAAGSECAWRRFQAVARRKGIQLSRREPLALNDCLQKLGMAPLESEDAAVRALAIRRLWRKLDNID